MASTQVQFLKAADIRRRTYSQYSQGSVASFATQFATDWGSYLPNAGAGLGVVAKPGAATVAEVIVSPGQTLELNPGDWIGYNFQVWEVVPGAKMGRIVVDAVTTSASNVATSATAAFTSADQGAIFATPNLPGNTTILSLNSATSVNLSANATASGSAQTVTITNPVVTYTPDTI